MITALMSGLFFVIPMCALKLCSATLTKKYITLTVSLPGRHPAGQTGIDLKRIKLIN